MGFFDNDEYNWDGTKKKKYNDPWTAMLMWLFLFVPILVAKLVGYVFGLLTHWGTVGRILQTLIMAILMLPLALILAEVGREFLPDPLVYSLATAFVILPTVWYFLWHFNAMKYMGASVFSHHFQVLCAFMFYGGIGSGLVGLGAGSETAAKLFFVVVIAGMLYYLYKTRSYSRAAAEDNADTLITSNAVKRLVMLVATGFTVVLCLAVGISSAVGAARREEARTEEILKLAEQDPNLLILLQKPPFKATITAETKVGGRNGSSAAITIPAGAAVTVNRFGWASEKRYATITYNGYADIQLEQSQFGVIKPVESAR